MKILDPKAADFVPSQLDCALPKRLKRRAYWISFLQRFSECSTYWYIPKARSLTRHKFVEKAGE